MLKVVKVFLCTLFISLMLITCKGKSTATEVSEETTISQEVTTNPEEDSSTTNNIIVKDLINFSNESLNPPEAHQKFLEEPLEFANIPIMNYSEDDKLAVVGSNVCEFLEGSSKENVIKDFTSESAKKSLIPLGTVVIIKDKIENPDQADFENMTNYQDYLNYFYEVEYDNKTGYVFGADLTAFSEKIGQNGTINTALLYKNTSKPDKFSPLINSYANSYKGDNRTVFLTSQAKDCLTQNHIAFENVNKNEYFLSVSKPDDMIALYQNLIDSKTPVFITTDLLAHTQHLIFDKMLQNAEENKIYNSMGRVITDYLNAIYDYSSDNHNKKIEQTIEKSKNYFQVAECLLKQGRFVDEDTNTINQEAFEKELQLYPEDVQKEVKLILDCSDFVASPIFTFGDGITYKEDYSQYKPRGHYTKTAKLSAYFRAQMWFGRINFLISEDGDDPLEKDGTSAGSTQELTKYMEPMALFIVELTRRSPELYEEWTKLFNPITELIGLSDDLSFNEIMPLWKKQNAKNFASWVTNETNLNSFMKLCHQKCTPPAIFGNSAFYAASEGVGLLNKKPPMGWKLLGQRFTYDSSIHTVVSSPRLYGRRFVTGLDILKAFGSSTADTLLQDEYTQFPELKTKLDEFEKFFASQNNDFWNKTYYNAALNQIRAQSHFSQGAGYYFTESPLWAFKTLNASLGTWAELRHDTILYVKQAYAEMGGGDYYTPTYRVLPVPSLVPYAEPNLEFYTAGLNSVRLLSNVFSKYNLYDEKNEAKAALDELDKIYTKLISITEKEIKDEEVAEADCQWMQKLSSSLASLVMIHTGGYGASLDNTDQLRMALIADVYTNIEENKVIEVGVAKPKRIYVALNDSTGGKRIAIGYTFDYVEFQHPSDNRMTDEEWKEIVYNESSLKQYHPSWYGKFFEE